MPDLTLQQSAIIRAFERAAPDYDEFATVYLALGEELLERLEASALVPQAILDLGCATGTLTNALKLRYPDAKVTGIDLSPAMLKEAKKKYPGLTFQQAEAMDTGLPAHAFDLIVANAVLSYCDPTALWNECRRLLRAEGLFVFTGFGPDTLKELRTAWQSVDQHPHVFSFMDMHEVGDELLKAQWVDPVLHRKHFTLHYPDIFSIFQHLKALGEVNAFTTRSRGCYTLAHLQRLETAYQSLAEPQGLPVTIEVFFGQGWAPSLETMQRADKTGLIKIPVQNIRKNK